MTKKDTKFFNVKDFVSLYSSEERTTAFLRQIEFPILGYVIMESCP